MNATFLKVLKEVLLGLPIMEPNMKRGNGIRRKRLGTKRVLSRSRLTRFPCHAQSISERERKREREREKTHHNHIKRRRNTYT